MTDTTKIEWADYTWNPWYGCTKVSPACDHCYAESWGKRSGLVKWGNSPRRRATPATWNKLKKWNRASADFRKSTGRMNTVFTCSLGDFFDNKVPPQWREDAWNEIRACNNLFMLILTKRPQNIAKMLPPFWDEIKHRIGLGVTVENQTEANRRIPHLLEHDCAVRFLSCEPLLENIKLSLPPDERSVGLANEVSAASVALERQKINWVIAGGESGPNARPSHPDWFRFVRDQCATANVPFLFKQWGEWTPGENVELQRGTIQTSTWFGGDWMFGRENLARTDGHRDDEADLFRIGKKLAGRHLDGKEHNQFPDFSGEANDQ